MGKSDEDDVIVLGGDDLDEIERNILIETFGKDEAEKLLKEVGTETEPLEEDLQEIVDSAPALDEI